MSSFQIIAESMKCVDGKDEKKGIDNYETIEKDITMNNEKMSAKKDNIGCTSMNLTDQSFYKLFYDTESDEEYSAEKEMIMKTDKMDLNGKTDDGEYDMDVCSDEENNGIISDAMDISDEDDMQKNEKDMMNVDGKDEMRGCDNYESLDMDISLDYTEKLTKNNNGSRRVSETSESFVDKEDDKSVDMYSAAMVLNNENKKIGEKSGKLIDEEMTTETKEEKKDEEMEIDIKSTGSNGKLKNQDKDSESDSVDYDESSDDDSGSENLMLNERYGFRGNLATTRTGYMFYMFDGIKKEEVVIKAIPQKNKYGDDLSAYEEVKNLKVLERSMYVPEVLDHFIIDSKYCLVFKKETISMDRIINMNGGNKLSNRTIYHIIRDVTKALDFIHSMKIIHRDVRLESMLLSDTNHLMLSGFGMSIQFSDQKSNEKQLHGINNWRNQYNNKYSTPRQMNNEKVRECEDIVQLSYALLVLNGVSLFDNVKDEDAYNCKIHFEALPHCWITDESATFLPLVELLLEQKETQITKNVVDYNKIYDAIEKKQPDICFSCPYSVIEIDGILRLN